MRSSGVALVAAIALAGALAACGDEETRYSDARIVERLHLEETENGYAIDGDPFCEVERKLLNDSAEVEDAAEKDDLGLVIASKEGNAGVQGVPPFDPECGDEAEKKLNKLDPEPEE